MTPSKKPSLKIRIAGYVFAVVFIIAGWWLTALALNSPALPTPAETLPVIAREASSLTPFLWVSGVRVFAGLAIGTVLAVPIALVCARSRALDTLFAPVLYLLYPIPKVVFLPVLLVLLGLADAPKIALIAITVFFQVLVAVRDAVRAVPEDLLLSIRALGANALGEYRHVVLPATIPAVFTSLRIGTGTAIAVLFVAESVAGSTGLGYFIMQSWALVNYPRMFAGIVALALMGVLFYAVFDIVERMLTRWRA